MRRKRNLKRLAAIIMSLTLLATDSTFLRAAEGSPAESYGTEAVGQSQPDTNGEANGQNQTDESDESDSQNQLAGERDNGGDRGGTLPCLP